MRGRAFVVFSFKKVLFVFTCRFRVLGSFIGIYNEAEKIWEKVVAYATNLRYTIHIIVVSATNEVF